MSETKGLFLGYNPSVHHRRSIRLPGRNYGQAGYYFVTLSVQQRACSLGEVVRAEMILNSNGRIAAETWPRLEQLFLSVRLDEWVVMPNPMHGILDLLDLPLRGGELNDRGASRRAPPFEPRDATH